MWSRENLDQFVTDTFGADNANLGCHLCDGSKRRGVNGKFQICRKSNGAQHSQLVFGEPLPRLANRPHHLPLNVRPPANIINDPR